MSAFIFFDVAPIGGGLGVMLGLVFFFIFAAVAFIAFKMLKRTVKMAVRMTIVAAILLVALIGGVAFLVFGTGSKPAPRSTPTNQKR